LITSMRTLCLALAMSATLGCAQPPASLTTSTTPTTPNSSATNAAPPLLTLEPAALALTQRRLQSGDAALQAPFNALKKRADRALQTAPRSVTEKTMVPPSGSKHDYMSMGPYWWPNPATANGLPYVQRDGQRNPDAAGNALDATRLQGMLADTRDLALAYYFTNDARYALKAAAVIRTWFITPATRMNPSLRFGQSVPGIAEGRGTGIIDTRDLWWVMDAVALIAPAGSAGGSSGLSTEERRVFRQWLVDYADWLHTSQLGRDEAAAKNNHGMFFDVQLAALWLYIGETEKARQLLFNVQRGRFGAQIDAQGRMPLELARTRPYHYHTFTLEAMTRLARYSQVLATRPHPEGALPSEHARCQTPGTDMRCPIDLWRLSMDGKSLRGVLNFVGTTVVEPKSWAFATVLEPTPPLATALPVLLMAQRALPAGSFSGPLDALKDLAPDHVAWLLWPLP
jgi:Alginate lyase